uniref:Uncharacterized protein n=1 Tax=Laticauda laticaudata TaxID=8630 RepID=A0A8C5S6L6_LATLA
MPGAASWRVSPPTGSTRSPSVYLSLRQGMLRPLPFRRESVPCLQGRFCGAVPRRRKPADSCCNHGGVRWEDCPGCVTGLNTPWHGGRTSQASRG